MLYIIAVVVLIIVVGLVVLVSELSKKEKSTKVQPKKPKQNVKQHNINNYVPSDEHQRKANRKGELGEYKIDLQLEQMPKEFKSISDVLIRTKRGLTQIDHILISPVGIFVIETKNYMGKIYGNRRTKTWKQYSNGNKNLVYNPLYQNYGHIQAIKSLKSSFNNLEFYSVISFTKRCEELQVDDDLKTVEGNEMVVFDIKLSDLILRKYRKVLSMNSKKQLNSIEIEDIYQIIKNANITDPAIRAEHIEEVKSKKRA